jgi:hypothetical protein
MSWLFWLVMLASPALVFVFGPRVLVPPDHRHLRRAGLRLQTDLGFHPTTGLEVVGLVDGHSARLGPSADVSDPTPVRRWMAMAVAGWGMFSLCFLGVNGPSAAFWAAATWLTTLGIAAVAVQNTMHQRGRPVGIRLSVAIRGLPDVNLRPSTTPPEDDPFEIRWHVTGDRRDEVAMLSPAVRTYLDALHVGFFVEAGEVRADLPSDAHHAQVVRRLRVLADIAERLEIPADRAAAVVAVGAVRGRALEVLLAHHPTAAAPIVAEVVAGRSLDTLASDLGALSWLEALVALHVLAEEGHPGHVDDLQRWSFRYATRVPATIAAIHARVAPGAAGGLSIATDQRRGQLTEAESVAGAVSQVPHV